VTTLNDILRTKGTEVYSVRATDTVFDVMLMMKEKGVGALLVMDGDAVAGIVSERDVARKVTLLERPVRETRAGEIMSERVTAGTPGQTVQESMAVMTDKRIRHLPVLDQGRVVGMISIGDLVKAVIDEQQFKITQLEHYITS
jgi:Predicted signal-transduction protein containing cAMP-binding and CBS domains